LRHRGYGPEDVRTYAWFKTTLEDYFGQKRKRHEAANPSGYDTSQGTQMNAEEVARISEVF